MIKRNIFASFVLAFSMFLAVGLVATPVSADCAGVSTAVIDCDSQGNDKGQAIFEIIALVIKIMTAGVGIVAVGATIFGAIVYATSADNPEKIKKAKEIWINTVIGLALFAFLVAITNFLIPGGVF